MKLRGLIKRLLVNAPRKTLLTIYKSFIRPHLDYGDIFYGKLENKNFQNKLEKSSIYLAITGVTQGTPRQKLYYELGLHSLSKRRSCSKLIFFYKILNGFFPKYLYLYLTFLSQEKSDQKSNRLRSQLANKINSSLQEQNPLKKTFSPVA